MLIEIGEDIVEKALKNDTVAMEVLEQLATACRNGKHIVFTPIRTLNDICSISKLNRTTVSVYKKLKGKISELRAIRDAVEFSAFISYENPHNPKQLWVHPSLHNKMELYEETHLLAENLLDIDFFKHVSNYYQRKCKLTKCPICFFPLHGGGKTIKNVYEKEIKLGQHFCLTIIDSDKKYKGDKNGKTSEELKRIHNEKQPFNCFYYTMNDVCEIENLIPVNVIQAYGNNSRKQIFQLNPELEISYFDMKKGFVCCTIKDEAMYNYWLNIFNKYADLCEKLTNCNQCLKDYKFNVPKDTKNQCHNSKLIDGLGSDLLKNLLNDGNSIGKLKKVKYHQLTTDQQKEWETIGKLIFEWCCAGNKMRV